MRLREEDAAFGVAKSREFRFVTAFLDPVLSNRLGVMLLPDVGEQVRWFSGAAIQVRDDVAQIFVNVQVVPMRTGHQRH